MGSSPPGPFLNKPLGYSLFPNELFPVPGSWAGTIANLVHYKRHDKGGHFAVSRTGLKLLPTKNNGSDSFYQALERPKELLEDVEEWIPKAWEVSGGAKL